jgi:multidrug efflux pump subunit AcrA (membrane-fusion protein)
MFIPERNRVIAGLAAGLVFAWGIAGCAKKESAEAPASRPEAIPVRVVKVVLQDMDQVQEYVGNIRARQEVVVYPQVGGKIVEKVKQEGDAVKKGEVLAYIDRDQVGLTFERAPVESPISGTVGRVYVDIGTNLATSPSPTPVALVVDMETVTIDTSLSEKYVPKVALGQPAVIAVDAYPGEEFAGSVTKISPVLDSDTRSAPIEITVPNADHRLKSGMFAKIRLVIEKREKIPVVLQEAVLGKGDDLSAYVVEDGKAVLKKITVALRQGAYVGIAEGLKEGDRVVVVGQRRLMPGAAVRAEETP